MVSASGEALPAKELLDSWCRAGIRALSELLNGVLCTWLPFSLGLTCRGLNGVADDLRLLCSLSETGACRTAADQGGCCSVRPGQHKCSPQKQPLLCWMHSPLVAGRLILLLASMSLQHEEHGLHQPCRRGKSNYYPRSILDELGSGTNWGKPGIMIQP